MIIKCIAIDDEPLALEKMQIYIKRIEFLELIKTFSNAFDALNFLHNNTVDLIFLDIQMDEFNGIQFLETLKIKPKVILTTAYDKFAIKGYELDVVDYLLKPILFERFVKAVNNANDLIMPKEIKETKEAIETNHNYQKNEIIVNQDFIFVKTEHRIQKVNFSDILYIEGMKDYLMINTIKEKIMTLQSFKKMEEVLPQNYFVRVHKSFIIAIDKIESIERNRIKILGNHIPIGDMYRKSFFDTLSNKKII